MKYLQNAKDEMCESVDEYSALISIANSLISIAESLEILIYEERENQLEDDLEIPF